MKETMITYRFFLVKVLLALLTCHLSILTASAQGIPFLRNYSSDEYHGHSRNFDIEIGADGTVFVANFEGLMYYDHVEWHMLYTPGITRVTVAYRAENDTVWVGGYNYFGRIAQKNNGELCLLRIAKPNLFQGEVLEIWEEDGQLLFLVNDGQIFKVKNDVVELSKKVDGNLSANGLSDVVDINSDGVTVLSDITQTEPLDKGLKAVVRKGQGLAIVNDAGKELYTITEANGLCTNSVVYVAYDGHGTLWGATDDGVFSMAIPSVYSRFTAHEGLTGEVLSIEKYAGSMYVGTSNGLFRLRGMMLEPIPGINHACWQLSVTKDGLYAATANGVYRITNNSISHLSQMSATSLLVTGSDSFYSGEMDGVFLNQGSSRKLVTKLEKATKILKDAQGTIWVENLYGEIWYKKAADSEFKQYRDGKYKDSAATLVPLSDKVVIVTTETTTPFTFPRFTYLDSQGVTWLTNLDGKAIYRWKDNKPVTDLDRLLYPFQEAAIQAMFCSQNETWLGDNKGLYIINANFKDPAMETKPQLLFRTITLNRDSVLWGGYGDQPETLPQLDSNERNLRFTYSLNYIPLLGKTLYRYQLNDGNWSPWSEENDAEFINLPHGSYTIRIQALLANGEESEIKTMNFSIAYPFYMRWYMWLLYVALGVLLIWLLIQLRLRRMEKERQRLEEIIQNRTLEVVKQKNEIEEKSNSLQKALTELSEAQHELIRQEKMATVGKLTQGLIDRILNPLNYINNFSKLSTGLVKDIEANIEDDKEKMDPDNYLDTCDVLDMLRGNLEKVTEHGTSTTRTLKAMEEMLKDRSGGIVSMNLAPILRQDIEMLATYYAKDITDYGIKTHFECPDTDININGNAEQLSKTIMSLLGNSIYALVKKAQRETYTPELQLKATLNEGKVTITVYDNGIGIESTIIGKVFDPFFTTKPTGEASGVGLYLSREIIQNHGGDISVTSKKNDYSEFTIILPILTA